LEPEGFHDALVTLTTNFRNPAAHSSELSTADYATCGDVVVGAEGTLWKLLLSTGDIVRVLRTS